MRKGGRKGFRALSILILFSILAGCGGGGGGSSTSGGGDAPAIEVLPASHDFGTVTPGNSPAPLEIVINNNGTAALNVAGIVLPDANFVLDLSGGTSPCNSASPTISAGGSCTIEVSFQPPQTADQLFSSAVQISSNDSSSPAVSVGLSGRFAQVSSLTVQINQIGTDCGNSDEVTAYVSVTDQAGYPVKGLTSNSFSIFEFTPKVISDFLTGSADLPPISIAAVMDYSSSLTDIPDAFRDMELGLVDLVNSLRPTDEAEIIKFATVTQVVQSFTSNKSALTTAIQTSFSGGVSSRVWDSLYQAVQETAARSKDRKAVILISDGNDRGDTPDPISTNTVFTVIALAQANNIPVFPIAFGAYEDEIQRIQLQQLADDTGGLLFDASIYSDNLGTIYRQISALLFENQYVLKYSTSVPAGNDSLLNISAEIPQPALTGFDEVIFTYCP